MHKIILLLVIVLNEMYALKGNKCIIRYEPSRHKGALINGDNITQNWPQSINQTLGDNITQN
jgi:hypothetical protein